MLGPYSQNTIVVGDCLEVMGRMPNECVDLVVTDPPFHVTITSQTKKTLAYTRLLDLDWRSSFTWIKEASRVMREGASLYVFTNDDDISFLRIALREAGIRVFSRLHWIKTNPLPLYRRRKYRGGVELAFFCCKGTSNYFAERTQQELLSYWFLPIVGGKKRTCHPTQKPVELMMTWIDNSCPPGGLVFDPFMGSGTTAVAADRLGRKWFGCDINSDYVQMSLDRIRQDRLKRSQLTLL